MWAVAFNVAGFMAHHKSNTGCAHCYIFSLHNKSIKPLGSYLLEGKEVKLVFLVQVALEFERQLRIRIASVKMSFWKLGCNVSRQKSDIFLVWRKFVKLTTLAARKNLCQKIRQDMRQSLVRCLYADICRLQSKKNFKWVFGKFVDAHRAQKPSEAKLGSVILNLKPARVDLNYQAYLSCYGEE